jgi:hypothetical protein
MRTPHGIGQDRGRAILNDLFPIFLVGLRIRPQEGEVNGRAHFDLGEAVNREGWPA